MASVKTDILLSMSRSTTEDFMQQIVMRAKDYEFRRRRYPSTVERVWFYETAPLSAVTYICQIGPARTRNPGDAPLPETGVGNREFNERHPNWDGYDYAYPVLACWQLREPVTLDKLKAIYGLGGAPRGMVYVPAKLQADVKWDEQKRMW